MELQKTLQENYLAAFISRFASSQILILSQYVRPMSVALKRIEVIKISYVQNILIPYIWRS